MSPNPYEDETVLGPNHTRDSEPCDCDNPPDEEHASGCKFWFIGTWTVEERLAFGDPSIVDPLDVPF